MVALDLEASPVAGQVGSAVLDLQGNVLKASGTDQRLSSVLDTSALQRLYQILLDVGSMKLPSFRRVIITPASISASNEALIRYILSRDETFIYVIAQRHTL